LVAEPIPATQTAGGASVSSSYGPGGKNSNYGQSNLPEPDAEPDADAWIAALFARPITLDEYEEQRAISAQRNAAKSTRKPKEPTPCPPS
jgi:hypothetical protein